MKFDVIIGNPPYQENNNTDRERKTGRPLYHKFVELGLDLAKDVSSMIIPAKWYNSETSDNIKLRQKLLTPNTNKIVDFPKASEYFDEIQLSSGVCYYLNSDIEKAMCEVEVHEGNKIKTYTTQLKNDESFLRDVEIQSIKEKVLNKDNITLIDNNITSTKFGIPTYERGVSKDEIDNYYSWLNTKDIKYVRLKSSEGNAESYILENNVIRNKDLIDKYKVIIGYMMPGGGIQKSEKHTVITEPKLLLPYEVCTDTYQIVGSFETEEEASNFVYYLKTKTARFMIKIASSNAAITRENFRFIPYLNYNEEWDDEKLYKRYNFTENEIVFIESKIKDFGVKNEIYKLGIDEFNNM